MILYLSLFVYGLTTFISPCSLGLVTAYLTYMIKDTMNRGHGLLVGLSFMSAMSLVFFTFGYALSSLIPINLATSKLFYILAGGLMILLGVNTLGLIERLGPIRAIIYNISDRMDVIRTGMVSRTSIDNKILNAFIFGIIISIALGPCSLALVLPAVMMTLFNAPSAFHGGLQLLAFGVGHSLPVLLLSVLVSETRHLLSRSLVKMGGYLNYVLGVALILLGLWLITGVLY